MLYNCLMVLAGNLSVFSGDTSEYRWYAFVKVFVDWYCQKLHVPISGYLERRYACYNSRFNAYFCAFAMHDVYRRWL